jgi:hypothetical protein
MPNPQNLIPVTQRTKEEAKKIQNMGGQAHKEKRLKDKNFQELAQHLLAMDAPDIVKQAVKKIFPEMQEKEITNRMAMLASVSQKAIKGDIKAAEYVRDTAGEKPIERIENMGSVQLIISDEEANY